MTEPQFNVTVDVASPGKVTESAINIAQDACNDIQSVLTDISDDSTLTTTNYTADYGLKGANVSIDTAAGAMVIDDLMQKISTKVQVAAQLLSTANKMQQAASRALQG